MNTVTGLLIAAAAHAAARTIEFSGHAWTVKSSPTEVIVRRFKFTPAP